VSRDIRRAYVRVLVIWAIVLTSLYVFQRAFT
jgi:hypothetical protein